MLIDKGFTDTILSELISILNCIILYIIVDATHINKNSFRHSIICQVWKGLENPEVKKQGPRNAAGCPDTGRPQEGSMNSDHPRLPFTRGPSLYLHISFTPPPSLFSFSAFSRAAQFLNYRKWSSSQRSFYQSRVCHVLLCKRLSDASQMTVNHPGMSKRS